MQLEIVKAKGLAHNSYFLSDHGEAIVIDPRRDCDIYTELADRACAQIKYIFDSHCHEDFVTGSTALQQLTDGEIGHSAETHFRYGDHSLRDGETFYVGDLKVEVLSTPGHTNDSLCFVIYERLHSQTPLFVFTGDTLLAGDVGRTDLLGARATVAQSKKLYKSIFERLVPLGDHVIVFPTHGAGSVCGHNLGATEFSTIGYERLRNRLIQLDEGQFVRYLAEQRLSLPPYFRKARALNIAGPPPMSAAVDALDADEFEKLARGDTTIIDTREPGAFAGSHVPNAVSIWLDGVSFFPGWVLSDERVLLVTESLSDVEVARTYLGRLGFDNVGASLCAGMPDWRNRGKPWARLKTCSVERLKSALEHDATNLLDVREEYEWKEGHIRGARHLFVGNIKKQREHVPEDKPLAIYCSWGGRATLAASILLGLGNPNVFVVLGAIRAWKSREFPLERG
jgi:hydroxyacylglutathione hydrolase